MRRDRRWSLAGWGRAATFAQPVFCDIDADTLSIDLVKAEPLLSRKTKAIIAMDYDCVLGDHDGVAAFARKHGLRVIHDAAHAFGSRYKGQMVGSFSDICMFSFDPVKTITCGTARRQDPLHDRQSAWAYFRFHGARFHRSVHGVRPRPTRSCGVSRA